MQGWLAKKMILPNQVFNYLASNFYCLIQCFATMQQLYSLGTEMDKILAALSISLHLLICLSE